MEQWRLALELWRFTMKPWRLALEPWRLTLKLREAQSGNVEDLKKFGSDKHNFDEGPDPDPYQSERSDPDPHQREKPDPQHWLN
jgi:hypothetical protein